MTIKHLDHLNLTVRNLQESIDWYGRIFGFAVAERGMKQGRPWAILRGGEALLCLYEDPARGAPDYEQIPSGKVHGLSHFGLRITDRAELERTLSREQVVFSYPSPVRWPHSTAWYLEDPTGYEIEVAHWDDDRVRFDAPRAPSVIS